MDDHIKFAPLWSNGLYFIYTCIAVIFLFIYKYRTDKEPTQFRYIVWALIVTMGIQSCISLSHQIYAAHDSDVATHKTTALTMFILDAIFVFTTCITCIFIIANPAPRTNVNTFYRVCICLFTIISIVFFALDMTFSSIENVYDLGYMAWHICTFIVFMLTTMFIFHNKRIFDVNGPRYSFEKWVVWFMIFL